MTALQQISADNFRRMIESLPDGVHRLSEESIEILRRAAEKCAARAARHIKRGS